MLKRVTDRRPVLIAAGAAAVAAATRQAAAQAADMQGTVTYKGGAVIPKGKLEVYLEDPAILDKSQLRKAKMEMESDGKSKSMDFALTMPAGSSASPTQRIVARLEREDGWLLARGSAQVDKSSSVQIALKDVVY